MPVICEKEHLAFLGLSLTGINQKAQYDCPRMLEETGWAKTK
jgi:hypothetical protein